MDAMLDLFFDDEYEEENVVNVARIHKKLRDASNPLELPALKFVKCFRLNKHAFTYLLNEVKDHLKMTVRGNAIPPILKLCCALRFFAEGSYQKCSGNDFNVAFSQPTVSRVLTEILRVLEVQVCPKWIQTEMTEEEKDEAKLHFFEQTRHPGIIGCVDGSHFRIVSPKSAVQHLYLNRKGYYSLNVMILCDHKMKVRFVDARHPGANHDSFVWNSSELKEYLKNNVDENTLILGDRGYPLEPYLMTPFRAAASGLNESRYNTVHAKARNIIERTIGVIKNTFRCTLSMRGLHYRPEKATQIVNASCALHNINREFKTELPEEPTLTEAAEDIELARDEGSGQNVNRAREIRNNLMRTILAQ